MTISTLKKKLFIPLLSIILLFVYLLLSPHNPYQKKTPF